MSVTSSDPAPEPPRVQPVGDGVFAIDAGYVRPGLAAIHVLRAGDAVAVVDTGVGGSVPRVLAGLAALGIPEDAVQQVILTHIHLDHAGGAGRLMQALPAATLVVHPRGARHMADPRRLEAGARAVYGAAYDDLYGALVPVPEDRILATHDDQRLALGDRALHILHTPGHARHHHCIVDPVAGGVFTGDTFGIAYPELRAGGRPFVFPTTTPVHFDPAAAHASIDRIVAAAAAVGADAAWLTHFSRVEGLAGIAQGLHALLDGLVAAAEAGPDGLEERVAAVLRRAARAHGITLDDAELDRILSLDATLNAQGLAHWQAHRG